MRGDENEAAYPSHFSRFPLSKYLICDIWFRIAKTCTDSATLTFVMYRQFHCDKNR